MRDDRYMLDVARLDGRLGIAVYRFKGKQHDEDDAWHQLAWFPTADEAQAHINALKQPNVEAKRERARETMRRRKQRRCSPAETG